MSVVIRLMRAGAKKRPFYRMVVADSRRQRDGRFIEILGFYDPIAKPFTLKVDGDRVMGWIRNGATPSEQVASLLKKAGVKVEKSSSKPKKKKATADAVPAAKKKAARKVARKTSARKSQKKAARKSAKKKTAKA
jgi:small subunit ribosomal protein S16